ncbi:MAG: flagellar hook-associated protein FlgL [Deltaproteobacteria bacterium]|nr:flagellar hook-associated protein FlgL [Deltaproteobacteria bacterium]
MRVSSDLIFHQLNDGLQQALRRLAKVQEVASSGRQINRLSDNPQGAARVLDLCGFEATLDQYGRNIDQALPSLERTESVLDDVGELLGRAKELAVFMNNETKTAVDRQAAAVEVRQLFYHLVSLANSKMGDRYLFAGFKNGAEPFAEIPGGVTYNGDAGEIAIQANSSVNIITNLAGNELFQGVGLGGGVDLFDIFLDLETALNTNNTIGIDGIQTQIGRLDAALDQTLGFRTEIGARLNTANSVKEGLASLKVQTVALRSRIEDADAVQVFSELARLQYAYEAALRSAARTSQATLLDFLR